MEEEGDWDLYAVVRSCSAASSAVTTSSSTVAVVSTPSSNFIADFQADFNSLFSNRDPVGQFLSLQDPFEERSNFEELHELCKPFFPQAQPQSVQVQAKSLSFSNSQTIEISHLSSLETSIVQTQKKQPSPQSKLPHVASVTQRSKRRKNQLKKVCQVPAESLSSDIWAWRKYGQKPIKGSPYPRGYYRCSSSKGCLARKQVERNRSDPGMFIVTYTAEHNHPAPTHRNSLAGSTRQKSFTPAPVTAGDPNKTQTIQPACSSSPSGDDEVVPRSRTAEWKEEKRDDSVEDGDDDDDEFGLSDMVVNDDLFVGFAELDGPSTGDIFSDNFPASFGLPWIVNNAAAAAGGT